MNTPMRQQATNAMPLTVSQFVRGVDTFFKKHSVLSSLAIAGEISGYAPVHSGSIFFKLKDEDCSLECFVSRANVLELPALRNGLEVIARGGMSLWADGRCTMLVRQVTLTGEGALFARQEELRKRLERQGVFSSARKRNLPPYPFAIAIVTRRGSHAESDFRAKMVRASHITVTTVDSPVQGAVAGPEIANAIERANQMPVDLIVLARGGGSLEELFGFSTEPVVTAIVQSNIPVVTGIGHSAHKMLADLAADRVFDTPGDVASYIVECTQSTLQKLTICQRDLSRDAERALALAADKVGGALRRLGSAGQVYLNQRMSKRERLHHLLVELRPSAEMSRRNSRLAAARARLLAVRRNGLKPFHRQLKSIERQLVPSVRRSVSLLMARHQSCKSQLHANNPAASVTQAKRLLRGHAQQLHRLRRRGLEPSRVFVRSAHGRLLQISKDNVMACEARYRLSASKLGTLDPKAILRRGYAIVRRDGKVVKDSRLLTTGSCVEAELARGVIGARVESIRNAR